MTETWRAPVMTTAGPICYRRLNTRSFVIHSEIPRVAWLKFGPRSLLIAFGMASLICVGAPGAHAQSPADTPSAVAASSSQNTPESSLVAFYRWYLQALAGNRDPIHDDRAHLATFVSVALLKEIDRRINSPDGLDADYFTRAQDYFDDWASNVDISNVLIRGKNASAMVVLGATKESRQRLAVGLIREGNAWMISSVNQPGPEHKAEP